MVTAESQSRIPDIDGQTCPGKRGW